MSKKSRSSGRRTTRVSSARRKPARREPAQRPAARGRGGLQFVDMLLIAVVAVLAAMVVISLFVVFRGGL